MSPKSACIRIESIFHGRSDLLRSDGVSIEHFRLGEVLNITVTSDEPLKIVINNLGTQPTVVGASLIYQNTEQAAEKDNP